MLKEHDCKAVGKSLLNHKIALNDFRFFHFKKAFGRRRSPIEILARHNVFGPKRVLDCYMKLILLVVISFWKSRGFVICYPS